MDCPPVSEFQTWNSQRWTTMKVQADDGSCAHVRMLTGPARTISRQHGLLEDCSLRAVVLRWSIRRFILNSTVSV